MARNDYYPKTVSSLPPWHSGYAGALAQHGATVGITPAGITQAAADAALVALAVNYTEAVQNFAREALAWRAIVLGAPLGTPLPAVPVAPAVPALPAGALAAVEARTRQQVNLIKAHPAYTQAIGRDLGVIGSGTTAAYDPALRVEALPGGQIIVKFRKGGYPAVAVDCRIEGQGDFQQVAVALRSPFTDRRAPARPGVPEVREYRVQPLLNNDRVNAPSDIVRVVTIP